ncbi:hypothetical protein ACQP2E_15930 [Actinoplanes sp. CA-015351]|uniref:hypothetical protein n=1 Tax=Actinoplanes sp. CA-015351 TaxID=3239897 RepID=UPI003D97C125
MEAEWLVSLAASGSAALVAAAATDAWQQARAGFERILNQRDASRRRLTERRLDQTAAQVEQARPDERPEVRRRLQEQWQTRLSDLLEEDPTAAGQVQAVTDEIQKTLPAAQQQWVQHITASAPNATAQGVMFGSIITHPPTGAPQQ